MKKTIIAMMLFILMISIVSAADNSALKATLMKYEPQPAEPGKYVTAFIKLENTGIDTANNVELQVVPQFPFSIDEGRKKSEYIGALGGKAYHVAEFKIKVDENAVEGTNKLKVRYNIDAAKTSWSEKELDVSIQTQDAVLSVESIQTEPNEIAPGETGVVTLKLKNLADSFLSDIKVSLDLSGTTTPLAPYNSASEKNVYQLKSNEEAEFSFSMIAYPDATPGIYKIPLAITYSDSIGTSYTKSDVVGVMISAEPDIQVVTDSTTLLAESRIGTVVLKIINKGLTDVKFMNLKLGSSDDFEILSTSKEEYIGNLDSDDFETVEFQLMLKGESEVSIPLELEYRNSNNKLYNEEFNLNLKIHSAETLGQQKSNSGWIFIVIILAVVGYFIYRRRKNKAKK